MRGPMMMCGLDVVIEVVGGKWKTLLLWELQDGARRFGQLRRQMDGISEKVLIQQLRELEVDGIVHRHQFNQVPPRVEYSLTPLGMSLCAVLEPLAEWGEHHLDRFVARCGMDAGSCPETRDPKVAAATGARADA